MGRTLHHEDDPGPVANTPPSEATILHQAAVAHRRATLSVLGETGALDLETLAERVASRFGDDFDPSPERLIGNLHHNHLPQLAEAGLVVRDETTGVALHSNVDATRVRALLEAGEGEWEALGTLLSEERRERIVAILAPRDDRVSMSKLAEAVVAFEGATLGGPREAVHSTRVSLHHVDLPKLDAAGVVSFDHEDGRVELDEVPEAYRELAAEVTPLTV